MHRRSLHKSRSGTTARAIFAGIPGGLGALLFLFGLIGIIRGGGGEGGGGDAGGGETE